MKIFSFFCLFFVLSILSVAQQSYAQTNCTFTRDLEIGTIGEDVRCLQKYLNAHRFKIASTGVGSPGSETNLLRDLTKQAIIKWQVAQGISPATGTFGQKSRAKYIELITKKPQNSSVIATTTPAIVVSNSNVTTGSVSPNNTTKQKEAETLIKKAINAVKDDDEQIEDARDDGQNI